MTRRECLWLLASLSGARVIAGEAGSGNTYERGLMGTRFSISCHHPDSELAGAAVKEAFAEADRINEVASDYLADGELLGIGKHPAGTAVEVSPLLFGLLVEAISLAERTGGRFDPTLGPMTKLWRESRRRKALPDPETLERAKAAAGWEKLRLDAERSTVTFTVPGMRLDLGGIAKGQAADRMLAVLMKRGVTSAAVTCGGDVRVGDAPPGQKGWKVGVRNVDVSSDAATLILENRGVSTSGDLRQFVEIDGVKYSHIIDPRTGLGLTRPIVATVVAANATTSDAAATACCVGGKEEAGEIAERLNAEVFFGG